MYFLFSILQRIHTDKLPMRSGHDHMTDLGIRSHNKRIIYSSNRIHLLPETS